MMATGDPRTDKELRERITAFECIWNTLPLDVRVDFATEVGYVRLLNEIAKRLNSEKGNRAAAEHLQLAVSALLVPMS